MIGSLFVSLIAMAQAPIAPAPPPPPSASPMVIVMPPRSVSSRPSVTQTIAVQVRQDARILWSGELTRSSTGSASFNEDMRGSRGCAVSDHGRFGIGDSQSTGLNVSIGPDYRSPSDTADADDRVQVNVSRTHPFDSGDACSGGGGSSTVRFGATTTLARGRPVTLAGEGGLSIVLTLR